MFAGSADGLSSVYAAERGFHVLLMEAGTATHSLDDPDSSYSSSSAYSDSSSSSHSSHHRPSHAAAAAASTGLSGSGARRFARCARAVAQFEHEQKRGASARVHHSRSDEDDDDDDDDDDKQDKEKKKHKKEKDDDEDDDSHDDDDKQKRRAERALNAAARIELIRASPTATATATASGAAGSAAVPVVALDDLLRASHMSHVYVLKLSAPLSAASAVPSSAQLAALQGLRQYLCEQRILYVLLSGFWPAGLSRHARSAGLSGSGSSSSGSAATDILELLWASGYTVYDLRLHSADVTASPITTGPAEEEALASNPKGKPKRKSSGAGHGHYSASDKLAALSSTRQALRASNRRPLVMAEYGAWFEQFDRSGSATTPASLSAATATSDLSDSEEPVRGAVWTDLLAVANVADLTPFIAKP